ncbi:MAG: hypothetical protein IKE28_01260 [Solobacterium sp.]|nr:hypothetical protein [Solobacterium sp.]
MRICAAKETLNIERLELMRKGYLTKSDLMKFVPCGSRKASEMYRHISALILSEGKVPGYFGLDTARVLKYLHLTESQIRRFAADEERYINNRSSGVIRDANHTI